MKTPIYYIINDKAVKAVRKWFFKLEVLRYRPEHDDFVRDMHFLEHIYFPTETKALDTEIITKKEFDVYIKKLRRDFLKDKMLI